MVSSIVLLLTLIGHTMVFIQHSIVFIWSQHIIVIWLTDICLLSSSFISRSLYINSLNKCHCRKDLAVKRTQKCRFKGALEVIKVYIYPLDSGSRDSSVGMVTSFSLMPLATDAESDSLRSSSTKSSLATFSSFPSSPAEKLNQNWLRPKYL